MSARRETTERRDAMQEFADKIVAALESGVKPWVRPWDPEKCTGQRHLRRIHWMRDC